MEEQLEDREVQEEPVEPMDQEAPMETEQPKGRNSSFDFLGDPEQFKGTMLEQTPDLVRKAEVYITAALKMIHDKKAGSPILETLKELPPEEAIPQLTQLVHSQIEGAVSKKAGQKPDFGTAVYGMSFITMELANLGNAAGFFQMPAEDAMKLSEKPIQKYIHQGLKEGEIDPIQLQETMEALMPEEMRKDALAAGQKAGYPQKPGTMQAMEMYSRSNVNKERQKYKQIAQRGGQR